MAKTLTKPGPKGGNIATKEVTGKCVGRENVVVPPDEVQKLAALGCKNKEIANFFGVTGDAISRHFAAELTKGREMLKQSLRQAMLHNACVNHNATMQIWLSKQFLGMTDFGDVENDDKKPLPWND